MIPSPQRSASPINSDHIPENIKHNTILSSKIKIALSCLFGLFAGLLKLNGLFGLAVFFVNLLIIGFLIMIKCNFKEKDFFPSTFSVFTGNLSMTFGSFLFVWTLTYDIVYVY
ncbi:er membrane protein complex subunit 6 [Anaeramoeba flamelloides]|uniref:ER membrane protein complex subunit 6 n=1 Tax=Anaeramoeba flamelloides TaxID=1746091 RepID=A0ABQ8YQI8_9EUKA|nr:er membrane protein complex subunit 6 [Anaeramoeba flamelloides]